MYFPLILDLFLSLWDRYSVSKVLVRSYCSVLTKTRNYDGRHDHHSSSCRLVPQRSRTRARTGRLPACLFFPGSSRKRKRKCGANKILSLKNPGKCTILSLSKYALYNIYKYKYDRSRLRYDQNHNSTPVTWPYIDTPRPCLN